MKSHANVAEVDLILSILSDIQYLTTARSVELDKKTILSRVKHEGLSFLTITLPSFGDDFFLSLENGKIDSTLFKSFKKSGQIPAFMQGIVSLVFDRQTGVLLDNPCVSSIKHIRQMTFMFKKLLIPCKPEKVAKAKGDYLTVEQELSVYNLPSNEIHEKFKCISALLWSDFDYNFNSFELYPKHGPGATCESISGNQKFTHKTWYTRVDQYFPFHNFAYSNENCEKEFNDCTFVDEEQELPVKVITVPKTLKSPRIIAIEPVCMQYTQQAVSRYLIPKIERHRFIGGQINFTNQSVNQKLAIIASIDRRQATLDLSSASDRVPLTSIISMLYCCPNLLEAILACRSKKAKLDDKVISLSKFASMGSALCFPIESMYFYTLCILGLFRKHNTPVTSENIIKYSKEVFIYGDDIVIPSDCADTVIETLQLYNCKVNTNKSYVRGNFRESCGMDAYCGEDVTPTYLRHIAPKSRKSTGAIAAWVSTCNQLYQNGYWNTSSYMKNHIEKHIGKLPICGPCCSGLGLRSYQKLVTFGRWSKKYMRYEIKAYTIQPVKRKDKISSYSALNKCFLSSFHNVNYDLCEDHLVKTERRGHVRLKRRWISPY